MSLTREMLQVACSTYSFNGIHLFGLLNWPRQRTVQTSDKIRKEFTDEEILGVQEDVQIREQDFGNFQVQAKMYLGVVWPDTPHVSRAL
jgi:hypothetical protein